MKKNTIKCPCCRSPADEVKRVCPDCELPMRHFAAWSEMDTRMYRAEAQVYYLEAEARRAAGLDAQIKMLQETLKHYKDEDHDAKEEIPQPSQRC